MSILNALSISEPVSTGHPTKRCHYISDAIFDQLLTLDASSIQAHLTSSLYGFCPVNGGHYHG